MTSDDEMDVRRKFLSQEDSPIPSDPSYRSDSRSRSRSLEIPIPDVIPRVSHESPVYAPPPPPRQTARMRVGPLGGLRSVDFDIGTSRDTNPYPLGHPMNRSTPLPPPASMLEKYSFDRVLREEMQQQHARPRPRVFDEEGRRGLTQREIEGLNNMSMDLHRVMGRTAVQDTRIQDLGIDVMHVEILVNRVLRSIRRFYYVMWALAIVLLVVVARMF